MKRELKKRKLNKKGFTLVELMIVVAILGILVIVAVPIFSVVTKGAKTKACQSNMRIIRGNMVEFMLGIATINGEPYEFNTYSTSGVDVSEMFYEDEEFQALFDGGAVPYCTNGETPKPYVIKATGPNTFYIECQCEGCPNEGHRG